MFSELSFNKEGLAHGSKLVRSDFYNVCMVQNGMWMGQWMVEWWERTACGQDLWESRWTETTGRRLLTLGSVRTVNSPIDSGKHWGFYMDNYNHTWETLNWPQLSILTTTGKRVIWQYLD